MNNNDILPWVEKYRPKRLDDIIGQEPIVKRLKYFVQQRSFPNMIFAGPPGVGKTTSAIAFANELYNFNLRGNFKELNASDERGIDVIRGAVKEFAKITSLSDIKLKIIFLDEADALTTDAQHALRRTMERYSAETRFILSVNYSSKIIEPIQSRCVVFRFKPLTRDEVKRYIQKIAENEKLIIDENAMQALIDVSNGDLRNITNILQSIAIISNKIEVDNIYEIAAKVKPVELSRMLKEAVEGKFNDAKKDLEKLIVEYGISAEDLLKELNKELTNAVYIDDYNKLKILEIIADTNFRIVEGANELIQLDAMLARIASLKIV
ncbi:MAG: replication factor C small subunit [Candidatus Micrarchaeota archaeon]|nr:MAG: replication factor C small subunit [Candidatus Micrarchaeota archaeon]